MLSGVCKLTVDAIILAPRSFINFGNSNGSLRGYNLVVMAWHCRDTFFVIVSKIMILSTVREYLPNHVTQTSEFLAGKCIYKRVIVNVHTHMPRLYAPMFGLQCGLTTKLRKHLVSYMYKCLHVTFCS